jgi:hypothetical protein
MNEFTNLIISAIVCFIGCPVFYFLRLTGLAIGCFMGGMMSVYLIYKEKKNVRTENKRKV